MKNNEQMEMSLDAKKPCPRTFRSRERRQRAQWWFSQMRMVVEAAYDWKAAPASQPEQMPLPRQN